MPVDHLQLASNPKTLKALASNSATHDKVLFSMKVKKVNRKGKEQMRVLLITNRHVLNLMPDNIAKCNRCINIQHLHHISTCSTTNEFVLHVANEYDYRFKTLQYLEVVQALCDAYEVAMKEKLEVVETDTSEDLAKQVLTKTSLKHGPTRDFTPSQKLAINAAASCKAEADENDSEEDDAEEQRGVAAGRNSVVGGAFADGKSKFTADDFECLKVLGKGAFGKVMLVKAKKGNNQVYAMKVLSKQLLLERNEVVHTKTERRALEDTHHPFLVHLRFAFQTPTKLYLVMDYCNGGELFFHLKNTGRFAEKRAMLYAAEITSALEHLHSRKIIYRDLKPENVLLDSDGHVRVTDFGLAKDEMALTDKTHTFCGTPDYLAPEIIKGSGHGRGVDWWSLGTMIYEMLGGLPPYYSENVNLMYEQVLNCPLTFKPAKMFSEDAQDLLTGLLQKSPEVRTGSSNKDALELKEHPWFAPINWEKLMRREIVPEFKPNVANPLDVSNFDEEFTAQAVDEGDDEGSKPLKGGTHFDGFTYADKSVLGK
mmetsp:Transcript_3869/g.8765  ORF Transcript_3869/g.8765 Transcript_3869/m.8765 type:complete len:540 (-) Transcript_3869:484-2103(-)